MNSRVPSCQLSQGLIHPSKSPKVRRKKQNSNTTINKFLLDSQEPRLSRSKCPLFPADLPTRSLTRSTSPPPSPATSEGKRRTGLRSSVSASFQNGPLSIRAIAPPICATVSGKCSMSAMPKNMMIYVWLLSTASPQRSNSKKMGQVDQTREIVHPVRQLPPQRAPRPQPRKLQRLNALAPLKRSPIKIRSACLKESNLLQWQPMEAPPLASLARPVQARTPTRAGKPMPQALRATSRRFRTR